MQGKLTLQALVSLFEPIFTIYCILWGVVCIKKRKKEKCLILLVCVHYACLHPCALTWGALRPQCCGARESSVQFARAVLLGLQVINEKRDWMVGSLSYQFGHQLLQEQSKVESS